MIRAVLDINVLAGGFVAASGPLHDAIESWREGRFELLVSEYILEATERVWRKAYWAARFRVAERNEALRVLRRYSTIIEITDPVSKVATHAEDDLVLSVVVSGEADLLVTGDKELLAIGSIGKAPIISIYAFMMVLRDAERRL
ncbi:MAG: putative toxin-antitoxin system toxin component, PIN family [Thermomicrobiales bacterium]|nr:putative toxin-antitoxin system toxin component, PIN family [Thermomicrobiales bacterium]